MKALRRPYDRDLIRSLEEAKRPLRAWVEPRVREIYVQRGDVVPELVGSATLIMSEGIPILVTAAHVLRDASRRRILMATDEDFVDIDCSEQYSRSDFQRDLLGVRLPDRARHWPVSFFDWRSVAVRPLGGTFPYVAFGFPWRESSTDVASMQLNSRGVMYSAFESSAETYETYGRDRATELLLGFNRRGALHHGEIRAMKKPHGMSGGAVVLAGFLMDPPIPPEACLLCGVLTEFREGKNGVMIATRMDALGRLL